MTWSEVLDTRVVWTDGIRYVYKIERIGPMFKVSHSKAEPGYEAVQHLNPLWYFTYNRARINWLMRVVGEK